MNPNIDNILYKGKMLHANVIGAVRDLSVFSKKYIYNILENAPLDYANFTFNTLVSPTNKSQMDSLHVSRSTAIVNVLEESVAKNYDKYTFAHEFIVKYIAYTFEMFNSKILLYSWPSRALDCIDRAFAFDDDKEIRSFTKTIGDKSFLENINKNFFFAQADKFVMQCEESLKNYIDTHDKEHMHEFLSREVRIFLMKEMRVELVKESYRALLNYKLLESYNTIVREREIKQARKRRDMGLDKNSKLSPDVEFSESNQAVLNELREKKIISTDADKYIHQVIEEVLPFGKTQKQKNEMRRRIIRRFSAANNNKKHAPFQELYEEFSISPTQNLNYLEEKGYQKGYFFEEDIVEENTIDYTEQTVETSQENEHIDESLIYPETITIDTIISAFEKQNFVFQDKEKFTHAFEKYFVYTNEPSIKTKKLFRQIHLGTWELRGSGFAVLKVDLGKFACRILKEKNVIIGIFDHEDYEYFLQKNI